MQMTFVACVNDDRILQTHLLTSPNLASEGRHEVILQRGFPSAGKAYNDAVRRSRNDLMVFTHQDIYFPSDWIDNVQHALSALEQTDPNWAVLGCYGITRDGEYKGSVYSSPQGVHGRHSDEPSLVQTLDEIVLILRKSSGLMFDEELPSFHLYGASICVKAAQRGLMSYAIYAPCVHNTTQYIVLPNDFYHCCEYIRRVHPDSLPIQTTCIRISRNNLHIYLRRTREAYMRYVRGRTIKAPRCAELGPVLRDFEASQIGSR